MINKFVCILQHIRLYTPGYFPPILISIVTHPKITWAQREYLIKFLSLFVKVLAFISNQEMHLTSNITKHLNLASSFIQLPKHRCSLTVVMHQDNLSFVQLLLRTNFVFVRHLPLSQNTTYCHPFLI